MIEPKHTSFTNTVALDRNCMIDVPYSSVHGEHFFLVKAMGIDDEVISM